MKKPASFEHQQYLNLETFRRNGNGVKTPVWFVEDNGSLFVRTDSASGKVKRLQNNHQVRIAPCKMDGTPLGEWVDASANLVHSQEIDHIVDELLSKKYGLMKFIFGLTSSIQGRKSTIVKIDLEER